MKVMIDVFKYPNDTHPTRTEELVKVEKHKQDEIDNTYLSIQYNGENLLIEESIIRAVLG